MNYKYLIRKLGFVYENLNNDYNSENAFGEFNLVLRNLIDGYDSTKQNKNKIF
jgi:hypothetical protein